MNSRGLYAQAPAYAGGGMVPASNFGSANPSFNSGAALSGIGGLLSGLFGDSGAPYEAAMDQYQQWGNKAQGAQNPFLQAGQGAIGNYQNWLQGQQNPSHFLNNLMGQYQESPWAKYQQQQALRMANNMGSATGLTGSSPLQLQAQQNAANISSQDMNNWLQNVLGINTQYGQGQQNLMAGGQGAANALTSLYSDMGKNMGEAAYGKEAGAQNDMWNLIGGGLQLGSAFLGG
jgi:hypothetical protein